ncbi:MAG: hypothetical protein M3N26_12230 [Pseudomonadota bacterium]|nr:hypothetical protein [Pseudomonadota bacterium]
MRLLQAAVLLLTASQSFAAELPRLTGTLIGPGERTALFTAAPGGTVPVAVGEQIDGYVVSQIEPGRVQLDKADRRIVVSVEPVAASIRPVPDPGNVTFGLVLRRPGPPDE